MQEHKKIHSENNLSSTQASIFVWADPSTIFREAKSDKYQSWAQELNS